MTVSLSGMEPSWKEDRAEGGVSRSQRGGHKARKCRGKRGELKSGLEGSDRRVREPWARTEEAEEDQGGPRWGLS